MQTWAKLELYICRLCFMNIKNLFVFFCLELWKIKSYGEGIFYWNEIFEYETLRSFLAKVNICKFCHILYCKLLKIQKLFFKPDILYGQNLKNNGWSNIFCFENNFSLLKPQTFIIGKCTKQFSPEQSR